MELVRFIKAKMQQSNKQYTLCQLKLDIKTELKREVSIQELLDIVSFLRFPGVSDVV